MNNNKIRNIIITFTLSVVIFTGCRSATKITESDKIDENIVIETVETSADLLDEAKNNEDEAEIKNKLALNDIDNFKKFKLEAKELEFIRYTEDNNSNFESIVKDLIANKSIFADGKIYNYDSFIENYVWDINSYMGVYISDINNDGLKDLIVVSKHAGTGNFSSINAIFVNTQSQYELLSVESDGDFVSNDVTFLELDGQSYLCLSFGIQDEIYLLKDNKFVKIADESDFVNNDHIGKDYSLINSQIAKEYQIEKKLLELNSNNISYTNSGYSDEELLITYFKIKKLMELDDEKALADLIMYPIMYTEDDKSIKIYNREQFIENYDKIVTDDVKKAVLESSYKEIFSSWRGCMLGDGEVWFTNYIIAIN